MQLWRQVKHSPMYSFLQFIFEQAQWINLKHLGPNEHWDSPAAQFDPFPMPEIRQVRSLQHPGHQAEPLAGGGLLKPWQCVQGEGPAAGGP